MPFLDPTTDPRLVRIPHPDYPEETPPQYPFPPPASPAQALGPIQGPPLPPPPEGGSFLDTIINTLNAPRNWAWSGAPGGFEGQKSSFLNRIDEPVQWLPGETNGRLNQPPIGHLAWKGLKGLGGADLAYDILGDPLTYLLNRGAIKAVGEGAVGPAINAIPGNTAPTADAVVRALSLGDKLLNDAAELPLRGALWAGKQAVQLPAKLPGTSLGVKVIDDAGPRASTSLYDWATHQSPQTALKMVERQLSNVANTLRSKGTSLEMALSDWGNRTNLHTWPGTLADATRQLHTLQTAVQNEILDAATTNPHTAQIGVEVMRQVDTFRDILNGRYRELQRDLRARGAPAAEIAKEEEAFLHDSWQSLMDMTTGAREIFADLARDLHGPSLPGAAVSPEQMALVSRKLQSRMEQLRFLLHDLPGFMADLPGQFKGAGGSWYDSLLNRSMSDFALRYKNLLGHQNAWDKALRYVWDHANPGTSFPTIAARTPEERISQINDVLQQMKLEPVAGAGELYERINRLLPVADANRLKQHLEFWGQDFLNRDLFDVVTSRVVREHAKGLGLKPPGPVRQLARDSLQLWKTQAIDTPAYLLSNLMGGLFMGGLRGVAPQQVMRGLAQNTGTMLRGGEVEIGPLAQLNDLLETVTPHEVTSSTGAAFLNATDDVKDLLGRNVNIMDRIGAPTLGALGAAQGAYSGWTDTPKDQAQDATKNTLVGAGVGAATWGSLPITTKFLLTRLGGGLEAVMRQTAYTKALSEGISRRAGDLEAIATNALLSPRAGAAPPVSPGPLLAELRQRGGFISPSALEDWLYTSGKVDPDIARAAGKQWRDVISQAQREGVGFSHQIHFDYENLNNLEQLVKAFSPFATWGMKAYPFFAEELVKHPRVSLSLLRMTLEQEKERRANRLSDRFAGSVHVPALDQFWSAITGRPEKVYINPLRGLSPFADISQLGTINEDDTGLDTGLKTASAFGFSLNPAIEQLLRLTPLTSGSAPARGYWRHSAPIEGATALLGVANGRGIDLDAPVMDTERALRLAFRGLEPTDVTESQVLRRLDELALRETGQTITSGASKVTPYLEARYLRQGQHWDRAWAEVARENAGRSLFGALSQIGAPRALLSQEEEKIRAAQSQRALLDPKLNEELKKELRAGNHDKIRPDLVAPLTRASHTIAARYGESSLPPEVHQILMIPTVANLEQLRKWVSEEEETTNPLHLGYASGGSPEEVRLASALSAYYSLPYMLRQDPQYKHLPPEQIDDLVNLHASGRAAGAPTNPRNNPVFGPVLQYMTKRQEQMLAQEPMLAAYLRWQQSQNGYGNPRQFVKEVWSNEAKRRQFSESQPPTP